MTADLRYPIYDLDAALEAAQIVNERGGGPISIQYRVPAKRARVALARLLSSADQAGLFKVAGTRSKMIVPTLAAGVVSSEPANEVTEAPEPRSDSRTARYSKLIEGMLELLP